MSEYSPPKFPRGTIYNQGDFLYLYAPLKYITNIGTGSKVYKETYEGTARLRSVLSNAMVITQNASEIDIASTGKFYGVNGTNTAPTYSFQGDTDTGIHRPSANTLHLVSGGTDIIRCNDVTGIILSSGLPCLNSGRYLSSQIGTATNPTYQYYDGTLNDSGMFFKASTWEPSISHKSSLVAEFGTSNMTLYKTLSSGFQSCFVFSKSGASDRLGLTSNIWNNIDFPNTVFSQGSDITRSTSPNIRYTINTAGRYLIIYTVSLTVDAANNRLNYFIIRKNDDDGVDKRYAYNMLNPVAGTAQMGMSGSCILNLAATDYLKMMIYPTNYTPSCPYGTSYADFLTIYRLC